MDLIYAWIYYKHTSQRRWVSDAEIVSNGAAKGRVCTQHPAQHWGCCPGLHLLHGARKGFEPGDFQGSRIGRSSEEASMSSLLHWAPFLSRWQQQVASATWHGSTSRPLCSAPHHLVLPLAAFIHGTALLRSACGLETTQSSPAATK